jgi:hypothetical protein
MVTGREGQSCAAASSKVKALIARLMAIALVGRACLLIIGVRSLAAIGELSRKCDADRKK